MDHVRTVFAAVVLMSASISVSHAQTAPPPSSNAHGYQVRANITRELDNSFIRFNFKRLDDRLCCRLAGPRSFPARTAVPDPLSPTLATGRVRW